MAHSLRSLGMLYSILRDSFPALRSIWVVPEFSAPGSINEDDRRIPPWLHIIATGCPIPTSLKIIVLQHFHNQKGNRCCKMFVGTSEEVVGFEKRLPELLVGLEGLTIRFDQCRDPGRCVAYVWSVLQGMHNVLRFEYRSHWREDWLPYTLPAMQ